MYGFAGILFTHAILQNKNQFIYNSENKNVFSSSEYVLAYTESHNEKPIPIWFYSCALTG